MDGRHPRTQQLPRAVGLQNILGQVTSLHHLKTDSVLQARGEAAPSSLLPSRQAGGGVHQGHLPGGLMGYRSLASGALKPKSSPRSLRALSRVTP